MDKKLVAKVKTEGFSKAWWEKNAASSVVKSSKVGEALKKADTNGMIGRDGKPNKHGDGQDALDAIDCYNALEAALVAAKKQCKVGQGDTKDAIDEYIKIIKAERPKLQNLAAAGVKQNQEAKKKSEANMKVIKAALATSMKEATEAKKGAKAVLDICKSAQSQLMASWKKWEKQLNHQEGIDSFKDELNAVIKSNNIDKLKTGVPAAEQKLIAGIDKLQKLPFEQAAQKHVAIAIKSLEDEKKNIPSLTTAVNQTLQAYLKLQQKADGVAAEGS
ncbi:MAG: hypothetical protein AAGI13_01095 [Pseudomonadota bacterium]